MVIRHNVTRSTELLEPVVYSLSDHGKNKVNPPRPFEAIELGDVDRPLVNHDLPDLPDISEVEVVRHYTRLSRLNYAIDLGMYPLGSCTMKYNPKISEKVAAKIGNIHPGDTEAMQTILGLISILEAYLEEICGMDACTLWPAAGAHGELTGMMIIKKAMVERGEDRREVLIPDTAHGTNPASCTIAGFKAVKVPSGDKGYLEASTLRKLINEDVAALMITNPNTLGIFEQDIAEISELLHENGSYLYMDGANMNALMGIARPGEMGVDCMHLNLHKTFASPHGGGGPGSGPVLVKDELAPYLPMPWIVKDEEERFRLLTNAPQSIGRIHSGLGNVSVLMKTLSYISSLGGKGIREAAEVSVLIASYMKKCLKDSYYLPYDTPTLHEFVLTDKYQKERGVTTMDIAKALMDFGFHPPTVYFPLVVTGAMMIEPTETEPLDEIERFVDAMKQIDELSRKDPGVFSSIPRATPVSRVDEVWAARKLVLTWDMVESIMGEPPSK